MTVGQLNQICCEFAGIPATNTSTGENGERFYWYPPVSTDGAAMIQLIERLRAKGILWDLWSGCEHYWAEIEGQECKAAQTPMMALCLAVAELAALSKERAA